MSEQKDWEEQMGLAEETTQVVIYPKKRHKEEWKEAAPRNGYNSMSSYLYDLILEGQSYRREGFLSREDSEERIDELEQEVAALEEQLERERTKNWGRTEVDDEQFVTTYLSDEYRTLGEISRRIVESGALDDLVRKRVENKLYFLAARDRVDFEPGHGWKLTET